jgi:hypothetical protein
LSAGGGIQLPWFTIFNNLGTGTATLTPSSGTINGGASLSLPGGTFTTVYFDGTDFTAETPAVYGSGVLSLNSLDGALSLTSTGSTVSITPSGSTIDLEVIGSVTQLVAGTNIALSPAGGTGIVTVNAVGVGGYTSGNNSNGYWEKNPNGRIEQWQYGTTLTISGGASVFVPFPISYTVLASVDPQITGVDPNGTYYEVFLDETVPPTLLGFTVGFVSPPSLLVISWRATGY